MFTKITIHALEMGELNILIQDIVDYKDVQWVFCSGNGKLYNLLKVL